MIIWDRCQRRYGSLWEKLKKLMTLDLVGKEMQSLIILRRSSKSLIFKLEDP